MGVWKRLHAWCLCMSGEQTVGQLGVIGSHAWDFMHGRNGQEMGIERRDEVVRWNKLLIMGMVDGSIYGHGE